MFRYFLKLLLHEGELKPQIVVIRELKKQQIRKANNCWALKRFLDFFFKPNMEGVVGKISSNEFKRILTPELMTVSSVFKQEGYDLRIVGGAVRDLLCGRAPKDIDLSTTATPNEMIELFNKNQIRYIETGLQHGTLTAHIDKKDFEITTLRIDVETDGRHAKVQYTNDWKLDAERRDLTFNAMSLELNGTLYDYFNGKKDLLEHRVRFVGNAKSRIQEDYLRILRYFRFYGRIATCSDQHDEETLEIIKDNAEGLKMIAVERIWIELAKILTGHHAPSLLQQIYNLGIADYIRLPPYSESNVQEFSRVWNECKIYKLQPVSLLCSLVDTTNEAESLARKLKLSNAERNLGRFITEYRKPRSHEYALKPYQDMLVSCPSSTSKETLRSQIVELLHYQGRHQLAEDISGWIIPQFPLTGYHLKKHGLKPGPEFGKTLGQLKQIWKDSYYVANEQDLLDRIKHILK
ncbi:CCA tRNA nucleotidyltransferase 1, mitochondrial [Exaiptasia diaphana]|uniref:CCA tRNA nucleotidyltransferase 1, mitochondrial n=1 Tax=Exaiptasia diaphana TaxID=2652724 RepID=A0A913YAV2_EXADI|nr:CCA tRNA nucleotidyltransferase 1, mitochondrial [Exaiptasia diaphana]KXJ28254.1 CCA tRNA nucleotidyltransferase 1, mitochondrial [Exaiptasia diaphana]